MFCNTCEYSNIKHIMYHDTIIDKCDKCEICSLSLSNYYDFVINIILKNKIGKISSLVELDNLNGKEKKQVTKFLSFFEINFAELYSTDFKCNVCGEDIFELTFKTGIDVYICPECMRIYFYINEFDEHLEKALKSYNKDYFKFIKRFLQKVKECKNNVKK